MNDSSERTTPDACREALAAVLKSRAFERSEQLRAFLQFICEEELAGRGTQLNEYQIGVLVMGRPRAYSPGEDATVRNRAHSLRRKLDEYYSSEDPGAAIRISVPRGSYQPHFIAGNSPQSAAVSRGRTEYRTRVVLLAFLMGAITASLLFWAATTRDNLDPVMRSAWGPLVEAGGQTVVHVSAPLHLFVRPSSTRLPGVRPEVDPAVLRHWYRQFPSLTTPNEFFLRPTNNSLLWGDAVGTVAVGRVLTAAGADWEVWPARVAGEPVLRGRNAILFGRPEYSAIAARLLDEMPFTVEFNQEIEEYGVLERDSGHWWKPQFVADDYAEVVYGLLTVLPSEGAQAREVRTVLLTGTNSAGIQAAAEYFSSPADMGALRDRFRDGRFPVAYQVVIQARANSSIALDRAYVKHREIPREKKSPPFQ
ncbi:MAG: hypothetical protein IPM24_03965 [Bryobacterales bacterium]|nr:hypothetical protein [Bryobacterales bacterium]